MQEKFIDNHIFYNHIFYNHIFYNLCHIGLFLSFFHLVKRSIEKYYSNNKYSYINPHMEPLHDIEEDNKKYECNYKSVTNVIPDNMYNRMLFYEDYSNNNINEVGYGEPYIVRLKGRNFKNIPLNMFQYLQVTAQQVMKEFHAQTAVIIQNEIILVFSGDMSIDNNLFKGNTRRIGNIISSFAASLMAINTNVQCSFEASVIDFPAITDELKHLTFDYINYIRIKCLESRLVKVNPVFIKRVKENDIYKHIKFTLDRVKANSYYNIFFTTSTFNSDAYNGKIKFSKFYEMNQLIKLTDSIS